MITGINVGDKVRMVDGDRRFVGLIGVIKDIHTDDWLPDDMVMVGVSWRF